MYLRCIYYTIHKIVDFIPEAGKQLEKDWHDTTKNVVHELETKVNDLQNGLAQANNHINRLEKQVGGKCRIT